MRTTLIILFLAGCLQMGRAQQQNRQRVLVAMQKLAHAYQTTVPISFDVTWRYAAGEAPAAWLDSMQGHCTVHGKQYRYELDQTETICSDNYVILLFKEDQVMYLTKPAATTAAPGNWARSVSNPGVSGIDSLLMRDTTIRYQVEDIGDQQKISIEFTVPALYKQLEYYIDKRSGHLIKTVNLVRADQLYGASVRSLVEASNAYAVVECLYTNYRQENSGKDLFDAARYFKKEGNEWVTVAPYDNYKIFIGTPNL